MRKQIFDRAVSLNGDFSDLNDCDKFTFLFTKKIHMYLFIQPKRDQAPNNVKKLNKLEKNI